MIDQKMSNFIRSKSAQKRTNQNSISSVNYQKQSSPKFETDKQVLNENSKKAKKKKIKIKPEIIVDGLRREKSTGNCQLATTKHTTNIINHQQNSKNIKVKKK